MNDLQAQRAKQDMIEWLMHPNELGKEPAKIELVGSFEMDDMNYYIFKFKESALLSNWLLGVAGGYEENTLEHSGHIFSEMQKYNPETAESDARALVERIKQYWKEEAAKYEQDIDEEKVGSFIGFPLLSEAKWDKQQLISDLKADWDIEVKLDEEDSEKNEENGEDNLVFNVAEDIMAVVSLMPAPIPNGEAVENAKNNYMWPEAVSVTEKHQAHLMIAVIGKNEDVYEKAKYFTKVMESCCKLETVIGIYTTGTVFSPDFYRDSAMMMKEDLLPIYNWVYFGLYQSEKGVNAYTYGLSLFGKREMEVLDADASPEDIYDFLVNMTAYVLNEDVILNDGETIGFSENDKHTITLSRGVSIPQITLKISY